MLSPYFSHPRVAFNFATASLDSRVSFSRAGNTATRINGSGYVEAADADVATITGTNFSDWWQRVKHADNEGFLTVSLIKIPLVASFFIIE